MMLVNKEFNMPNLIIMASVFGSRFISRSLHHDLPDPSSQRKHATDDRHHGSSDATLSTAKPSVFSHSRFGIRKVIWPAKIPLSIPKCI